MTYKDIPIADWLRLNSELQIKKNALRKDLKAKGVLKKGGKNDYDHYRYFSEAQYKELFTDLFSTHGLELKFNELEYSTFEGTEKQANGRMPKLEFSLIDIETGFYETTVITGEGIDKGDKAGYKAYTGALKYYLANTFMVATGDDPEKDSPDEKMNKVKKEKVDATKVKALESRCLSDGVDITKLCKLYKVKSFSDLTMAQYMNIHENWERIKGEWPTDEKGEPR